MQSKIRSQISGLFMIASTPLSDIVTPNPFAFFMPAELKLRPANKVQAMKSERNDFSNKSVPILPVPMMAIFNFLNELINYLPGFLIIFFRVFLIFHAFQRSSLAQSRHVVTMAIDPLAVEKLTSHPREQPMIVLGKKAAQGA